MKLFNTIESKLSSIVSRSSVSVYQVSLWLVAPKTFQAKLDSVRIFSSKDSVVILCDITCSYQCIYLLASLFVYRILCAFGLLCSIVCLFLS